MKEKSEELAKYRIEKAKATLSDAEKYLAEAILKCLIIDRKETTRTLWNLKRKM